LAVGCKRQGIAFPLDGEGQMNDHRKQTSVNSRRSFMAGFGGVLAAAAALTKTAFGGRLKREGLLVAASAAMPRHTEHHIPRDGVSLHVEDYGGGKPVLLLHGWPDSSYLWRNQIPFLVANGFRAIAPDQRGFGRSDRPEGVAAYSLQNAVADVVGVLDALGIDAADIVAHDWGAAVAWLTATVHPNRVRRLVVLSVPHPLAPYTLRQREMAWYMLFFQFEGIAEAWLQRDDWALFREMLLGNGDIDRYISDLSRPDALKASLNWYRANLAPRLPGPPPRLPPVEAPTLGIWSSNDHYLDGERMKMSGQFVKARWRYEQINDASHWIPLDAPDRLNQFLIEWLR
jgi:pimeloyl-ACP methyl ester carboxylesterase